MCIRDRAVPLHLRDKLGFDLRKSTGEKTLDKALLKRDIILNDLKSKFCEGNPESSNIESILPRNVDADYFNSADLKERVKLHSFGIKKRFPQLTDNLIESTWSGIVSRTRNSSQIFEKIDDNVFVAGCYNGSGIGVGTLFGEQIAIKASNENSKEIETIEARNKPTWLPPDPILSLGVRARLIYERFRAKSEI